MPIGLGVTLGIGGGKPATSSGAPPPSGGGWTGNENSLSLDGTDDYVALASSITIRVGARTISAWFKITTHTTSLPIVGADSNAYLGVAYAGAGGPPTYLYFYPGSGSYPYVSAGSANILNEWHHLVVMDSGGGTSGSVKFFLDAVDLGASGTSTGAFDFTFSHIGRKDSPSPDYWSGFIDEVAVWASALSSAQITNIYKGEENGGSGGSNGTPGDLSSFSPLHWWRCGDDDGGTGTTLSDNSNATGTPVAGTLTNGAAYSTDVA